MYSDDLLDSIRIYQFCAVELNLFLDNFPDNENAKDDYKTVSGKLTCLINEYEENYGPLTSFGSSFIEDPRAWTEQAWPWENYEKEE
ncbi:spore coat protein CotJB [Clostridium uliginosum]|uniref:Spore coat protein JB n=1 Tax=Clostridium uliginosum TaxID=119641 RepID=A0A1I1Q5P7_9CLOT|nr:spore coat protein CotJB [Clostridium uliginosum]SFD13450.1 spore coat protein JB [Clostridium uliginosum]